MKAFVAQLPPGMPRIPLAVPINLDPPEHTKYRAPLQKAFSPKTMLALKESIRALANELIDKVIDRGHCDFMVDIAEPLPVQVFLKLLGLPLERQAEYRAIVRAQLANTEHDAKKSMMNLIQVTRHHARHHPRASRPAARRHAQHVVEIRDRRQADDPRGYGELCRAPVHRRARHRDEWHGLRRAPSGAGSRAAAHVARRSPPHPGGGGRIAAPLHVHGAGQESAQGRRLRGRADAAKASG